MVTTENLLNLFETKLKPALQSIEGERKSIAKKYAYSYALLALGCIVAVFISDDSSFCTYLGIGIGIIGLIVMAIARNKKEAYTKKYKDNVVKEIVKLINPEWAYVAEGHIFEEDYFKSELFNHMPDRYYGDDLVVGQIDKTDFHFSELHTEYVTRSIDDDGKREETWTTIFRGIFAHADFNKNINGSLFIEPDVAENLFGKIGQKLQNLSSKGELIKMEDPTFEKLFVVHGSDQIEARYILTPKMMEAIVNIYNKYEKEVRVSFVGSRVYVAMSFNEDLFEPRIWSSGLDFKDIEQMNEQFKLIEIIISEMNLNTRIWTKK